MANTLKVHALPKLVDPQELQGGTVVVIDVLRASTTIVHALEAGATEVVPCVEVDDAFAMAGQFSADEYVLGGERDALPIEKFDVGNSPKDYLPHVVANKTLILTTTNSTRALEHARGADQISR